MRQCIPSLSFHNFICRLVDTSNAAFFGIRIHCCNKHTRPLRPSSEFPSNCSFLNLGLQYSWCASEHICSYFEKKRLAQLEQGSRAFLQIVHFVSLISWWAAINNAFRSHRNRSVASFLVLVSEVLLF